MREGADAVRGGYRGGMQQRARQGIEVGVGLALLGVRQWMTVRPEIEAELDRLGFGGLAEVSRQLGETVSDVVDRLASPTARR
jgi:hypothetical protein